MITAKTLDTHFQTSFGNGAHDSVADIPVEKGGAGKGFGPHELLEAALATCQTITVQLSAEKHGFPLTGARCVVRLDRSVPDTVTLLYDLQLEGPLTPEQVSHLRAAAARCPVGKTLSGAITLEAAP